MGRSITSARLFPCFVSFFSIYTPYLQCITNGATSGRPCRAQTRPDLVCVIFVDMVVRNISQAKAELSALIEQVLKGNEVILAKAGKPVARLVAYQGPSRPRTPGCMAGEISLAADFDSLPDEAAAAYGDSVLLVG